MSSSTAIDLTFDQRVAPIVFASSTASEEAPAITVVAGQPGAGKSAAVPALVREAADPPAVVSAEGLAAFHPDYLEQRRWRPLEAQSAMAPLVAEWLSQSLDFAREHRRSLVLEGSFSNPAGVFGTVDAFAAEGFSTRVVVVSARRSESLLTSASRYFEARRRGAPALFTDRDSHERGWVGAQDLVREAEATTPVDQLTILGRGGQVLFDAIRSEGFAGAAAAIAASESAPVTTLQAAEWFGELRRVTEYARDARELTPPVANVLVDLHELALNEVLPHMQVRRQSSFYIEQEARLSRELVSLRRDAAVAVAPSMQPAPVFVPPAPSPRGPSL
ncbi:zeta toxin family protein [Microbacter sp. GSS18]|nr:zeta toxin family protein [Microbacter sp. GSS18]